MEAKQIVTQYLKSYYETTNATELAENWGVRIRKQQGGQEGTYEVATTYFYQDQNSTDRIVKELTEFASQQGKQVIPFNGLNFKTNPWPKRSWATQLVTII